MSRNSSIEELRFSKSNISSIAKGRVQHFGRVEDTLLEHASDIRELYGYGFTPSGISNMLSGAGGSLECVKFLGENNILTDIHKKSTKFGDTPLTLAFSYEHDDIVNYFKKKFNIKNVSLEDLDVILDRVRSNFKRLTY